MRVLHPYSLRDPERKARNWAFVRGLKQAGYVVLDFETARDEDYWDFVAGSWGMEELIVLEDDKTPTTEQWKEMVSCERLWCVFPYSFSMRYRTRMQDWTRAFPYGLGFTRFSLAAQEALPVSEWEKPLSSPTGWCLDRSIERPLVARVGLPHIHGSFVRHDHPVTLAKVVKSRGAQALTMLGLRKADPLR